MAGYRGGCIHASVPSGIEYARFGDDSGFSRPCKRQFTRAGRVYGCLSSGVGRQQWKDGQSAREHRESEEVLRAAALPI